MCIYCKFIYFWRLMCAFLNTIVCFVPPSLSQTEVWTMRIMLHKSNHQLFTDSPLQSLALKFNFRAENDILWIILQLLAHPHKLLWKLWIIEKWEKLAASNKLTQQIALSDFIISDWDNDRLIIFVFTKLQFVPHVITGFISRHLKLSSSSEIKQGQRTTWSSSTVSVHWQKSLTRGLL